MELPSAVATLGRGQSAPRKSKSCFEPTKNESLDVWAFLRVNLLDMPRSTSRASEGTKSQQPTMPYNPTLML